MAGFGVAMAVSQGLAESAEQYSGRQVANSCLQNMPVLECHNENEVGRESHLVVHVSEGADGIEATWQEMVWDL